MIWRFIFILSLMVGILVTQFWFFDDLGLVNFSLFGFKVDTNIIGLLLFGLVFYMALRFIIWGLTLPRRIAHNYKIKHLKQAKLTLFQGLAAFLLKDSDLIEKTAGKLNSYWGENPVSKYFDLVLAKRRGKKKQLKEDIQALLEDEHGSLMGLFYRAEHFLEKKNFEAAYEDLKSLSDLSPYSEWALVNLVEVCCHLKHFDEAEDTLKVLKRFRIIPGSRIKSWQEFIWLQEAKTLENAKALKKYEAVLDLNPDNQEARLKAMRLCIVLDKNRKLRNLAEKAWDRKPNFQNAKLIAEMYVQTFTPESPNACLESFKKLLKTEDSFKAGQQVYALYALKAEKFEEAQDALQKALNAGDINLQDHLLLSYKAGTQDQKADLFESLENAIALQE